MQNGIVIKIKTKKRILISKLMINNNKIKIF
jgi:hypothetical protein